MPPEHRNVGPRTLSGSGFFAVLLGGALGTLLRVEILRVTVTTSRTFALERGGPTFVVPEIGRNWLQFIPWGLILINTAGVFVATWYLARPGAPKELGDPFRLFVVTGLLGGLTSYSTLIASVARINQVSTGGAVATTVGAIGIGLGAAALGVKLAQR